MRDLFHKALVTQHLNPVTSITTKTSTTIDLQGFDSACVVFSIGQSGDTLSGSVYWTLKIQHSDDDSSYTDVVLAELNSTAATVVVDSSSKDKQSYTFGYAGGKRYLKGVATPTGTHTNGTPVGILAVKGTPSYSPVA
jgi:hypothetical protein